MRNPSAPVTGSDYGCDAQYLASMGAHDLVVKAMSWALWHRTIWDRDAVESFLASRNRPRRARKSDVRTELNIGMKSEQSWS